jgi:hypothetical protein
MQSEALPCRWYSLLVRLRLIAKPQMVRKALLAADRQARPAGA